MRVEVYYDSGSVGVLDTATLPSDGAVATDDYLDATDLAGRGLVLVRGEHALTDEGDSTERVRTAPEVVVAAPSELANVYAVAVEGRFHLVRGDDGTFVDVTRASLTAGEEGDE